MTVYEYVKQIITEGVADSRLLEITDFFDLITGKVRSQNMEKRKSSFPTFCKQTFPQLHKTASYAHSHSAYVGEILRITYNMYNLNFFQIYH